LIQEEYQGENDCDKRQQHNNINNKTCNGRVT